MKPALVLAMNFLDGNDPQTSSPIDASFMVACSVFFASLGDDPLVGTLTLQASNQTQADLIASNTDQVFTDIPGASITLVGTEQDPGFMINYTDICYKDIRLSWTPAGSGSFVLFATVKGNYW